MQYNTFTIQNFRGIEELTIKDLKMINLLVGRNNCGKTSVLEAFFLLSGMSNPQLPFNIHNFRNLILKNDEDFSFMFKNLDFNIPITLKANLTQSKRKLIIKPLYTDPKQKNSEKQLISEKKSLSASDSFSSTTSFNRVVDGVKLEFDDETQKKYNARFSIKGKEIFVDKNYKETLVCSFINRKTIDNLIDKQMERLLVQKQLSSIIAILQEIDPNVSDIRMGAGGMIYVDIGQKSLLPINIMGDGIIRLLSILAYIADMKNGIVLIDEIENGFHYSSLTIVWKALFKASLEYNVQIVATTHSYECIEAYSKTYQMYNPDGDDIRLFRIDRTRDKHRAYPFTAEILKAGIEKDFEVR